MEQGDIDIDIRTQYVLWIFEIHILCQEISCVSCHQTGKCFDILQSGYSSPQGFVLHPPPHLSI